MLPIYHENRDTVCHFLRVHKLFIILPFFRPPIFGTPQLFPGPPGEAKKFPPHLKKSCAHGPAGGEGCPGSTYGLARGFDSRLCAYVLNLARARFGGPACPVWPGPRPPVRPRPGPAGWLGKGGVYIKLSGDYTARIKPLRRGWRTVPASWLAEFWRAGFQSPPQSVRHRLPVPVRPWPLVLVRRGSSPTWCRSSGGRGPPAGSDPCCRSRPGAVLLWRGAGPLVGAVLRLAPVPAAGPAPAWSFSGAVPVLWWARSSGAGPAPGPARPFPKATAIFPPPTPGRKFPAIFPARYFMRAV